MKRIEPATKAGTWLSRVATATFVQSEHEESPGPAPWCPTSPAARSESELTLLGELRELAPSAVLRLADLRTTLLRLANVMPLSPVVTEYTGLLQFLREPLEERIEAFVLAQLDMNRLRHLASHPFGTEIGTRHRAGTLANDTTR